MQTNSATKVAQIGRPAINGNGNVSMPTTTVRQGLMARTDAKLSEKVELSKGTVAVMSLVVAVAMLVLSYGGSVVGWVREDESNRTILKSIQEDLKNIKEEQKRVADDQRETNRKLQALEIKEAYKLGAGTSHENEKEKK